MVLEHLFPEDWLEKKARYAFLIAAIYSTIGIMVSRVLFGANSGIVSVFFASLLIMPYLKKLFKKEGGREEKLKDFSLGKLIKNNMTTFKVYLCIFLGVYFTYNIYAFIMPLVGADPTPFFREQLMLDASVRGQAFTIGTYTHILSYNWWVLLACFILALIAGDGAIFFIVWNASSWGTLMGYRAVTAALVAGVNPWYFLGLVIGITFSHMVLEGTSYILAAIAGGVISEEVIKKARDVKKFVIALLIGGLLFGAFYIMLLGIFDAIHGILLTVLTMIVVTLLVFLLGEMFKDKRHKEVFKYNFRLFVIAVLVLTIAALVETFVITNSHILNEIYMLSFMYR